MCLYQIINNDFYHLIFILHSRVANYFFFVIFYAKLGWKKCSIKTVELYCLRKKIQTKMNYMLARVCKWNCLKIVMLLFWIINNFVWNRNQCVSNDGKPEIFGWKFIVLWVRIIKTRNLFLKNQKKIRICCNINNIICSEIYFV